MFLDFWKFLAAREILRVQPDLTCYRKFQLAHSANSSHKFSGEPNEQHRTFLLPLLRANENSHRKTPFHFGIRIEWRGRLLKKREPIRRLSVPLTRFSNDSDSRQSPKRADEGERAAISTGNYPCTWAATWSADRSRTTWKTENRGKERTLVIGNRPGIFTVSRSGIVSPAQENPTTVISMVFRGKKSRLGNSLLRTRLARVLFETKFLLIFDHPFRVKRIICK